MLHNADEVLPGWVCILQDLVVSYLILKTFEDIFRKW